jgi:hypothetical protein
MSDIDYSFLDNIDFSGGDWGGLDYGSQTPYDDMSWLNNLDLSNVDLGAVDYGSQTTVQPSQLEKDTAALQQSIDNPNVNPSLGGTSLTSPPTPSSGGGVTGIAPIDAILKMFGIGGGGTTDKATGGIIGSLLSLLGLLDGLNTSNLEKLAAALGLSSASDLGKTATQPSYAAAVKAPEITQAAIAAAQGAGGVASDIAAQLAAGGQGYNPTQESLINAGVLAGLGDTTPGQLTSAINNYVNTGADLNTAQLLGAAGYEQALQQGKQGMAGITGDLYGSTADTFTNYLATMGITPASTTQATNLMQSALSPESTILKANTLNLIPNYQNISQAIQNTIAGGPTGVTQWTGDRGNVDAYIANMTNAPSQYGLASNLMAQTTSPEAMAQMTNILGLPGTFGSINDYISSYLAADPTDPARQQEIMDMYAGAAGPVSQQEMLKSLEKLGASAYSSGPALATMQEEWANVQQQKQLDIANLEEKMWEAAMAANQSKAGAVSQFGTLLKNMQDIYSSAYLDPVQKQAALEKEIGDALLGAQVSQAGTAAGFQGTMQGLSERANEAYNTASLQAQQNYNQAVAQAPGALNTLTTGYENALIKPSTDLASYLNTLGQQELAQRYTEATQAGDIAKSLAVIQEAYKAGFIDPDTAAALNLQNLGTTQYQGTQTQAGLLSNLTAAYNQYLSPATQAKTLSDLAGLPTEAAKTETDKLRAQQLAAYGTVSNIYSPYTTQSSLGATPESQSALSKLLAGASTGAATTALSGLIG